MAIFDYSKAAAVITSSPNPVLDALGTQFGVPQCMLDFTKDVLKAFPSPVLQSINSGVKDGKALADSVFKDIMRKIFLDTGIVEYDTSVGRFVFVSSSSNLGVEENMLQTLNNLAGFGKILGFGAQAVVIGENVGEQIDSIKNCIDKLTSFNSLQKGASVVADKLVGFTGDDGASFSPPPPALEAASQVFDENKGTLESAANFVAQCNNTLQILKEIFQERKKDPLNNPEPVFWKNAPNPDFDPSLPPGPDNPQTLGDLLGDSTTFNLIEAEADEDGNPIPPQNLIGDAFDPFTDVISSEEILPPFSKKGQFIYSKKGIYYDSQNGGINYEGCISNLVNAVYFDEEGNPIPGTGVPEQALKWLFKYNPNLGGKGEQVSWKTFNNWVGTVFDLDHINESPELQEFYEADHFLQVLLDTRNKEIYDLSSYITELQNTGYSEESAVVQNQKQSLYSKIAAHDKKIKKRKKQIEIHVVLSPENHKTPNDIVPVNDFESLNTGLLAVEKKKQESLIFNPGDVSGIVLPICPKFLKSEVPQNIFNISELNVPPVGVGQIITSDPYASGTSGTLLSLTDQITTRNLVSIYNFLDADIVKPDSDKYFVINCTTDNAFEKPAQLVGSSIDSVFPSGIGLPYFRGICNFFSGIDNDGNPKATAYADNPRYLRSAFRPYGYVKIKPGYDEIDSLFYTSSGVTIDFWTHIPDLLDSTGLGWNADNSLSSLHRVVLGCENRGGSVYTDNDEWLVSPYPGGSVDTVKGLLIGFSRDRRITKGELPSNNPSENSIDSGLVFHMSPTQSVNTSGITFLSVSANITNCPENTVATSGFYGINVDTSTVTEDGISINSCTSSFAHIALTVNYGLDQVNIYLNGKLLKSQSVEATFGFPGPPNIPSMISASSFNYYNFYEDNLPHVAPGFPPNAVGQTDFWYYKGPKVTGIAATTPWIIGGGYTDGIAVNLTGSNTGSGGFMATSHGLYSGLTGHVGSFKIYSRPLDTTEALKNYEAHKGYYEDIRT